MMTRSGHRLPSGRLRWWALVVPLAVSGGCGSIPWRIDFDNALRTAAQERRRAVVLFVAASNPESREMDWFTFTDPKVQEMMREFVPIRLDYFMNQAKADQLGVTKVPTFVVIRPDGTIAGLQSGNLKPEDLRIFLIKNRYN